MSIVSNGQSNNINMKIWYILIVLKSIPFAESNGIETCKNRSSSNCCKDFYKEGSLCKPCIGSFGVNCSGGFCKSGYYGHGCKEICHCGTIVCDRKNGCPQGIGIGGYHHWIYIMFGILAMNSILITIAVSGFLSTRQRDIRPDNSLETPKRKGKLNIYVDALLKRVRRAPSEDDDNTDTESSKGYFDMRMSVAPPKSFTDPDEDENDDDDLEAYVEMNLQNSEDAND